MYFDDEATTMPPAGSDDTAPATMPEETMPAEESHEGHDHDSMGGEHSEETPAA